MPTLVGVFCFEKFNHLKFLPTGRQAFKIKNSKLEINKTRVLFYYCLVKTIP